jgi:hypothetical protein
VSRRAGKVLAIAMSFGKQLVAIFVDNISTDKRSQGEFFGIHAFAARD